jgi:diaminohydroxyphosphoribosylaminopyrimidine deaminase/5-amino-6-(5-phosphoribosylamino)uracil reductase
MFSEFDRLAMTRAVALAERGLETTHPNPRVGCVIAKGERIIAEGWHERAGEAHAEVAALRAAKEPVAGATAYVTLEPCSHHGRTPPCVNALIEARIGRVVFAVQDPNPLVSGQGAAALLRAGIAVEAGLMEAEATELNIGFMKRMKHGLPWVRVKLAMSLDGRTALANGASQWITGEQARNDVQRWRARCSAVMTGVGTMLADDPQLNVRTAGFKGRQPLRVVLDSRLRSPPGAKMFVGLGVPAAGGGAGTAARAGGVAANPAAGGLAGTAIDTASVGAAAGGDVLIFAAAGGGVPPANPVSSAAPTDSADLADDMAALVNAFETSPTAVAARSADVTGQAGVKSSAQTDAPSSLGGAGVAGSGVAAKGVAGAAAASPPDDATWAGAALSGAVPVGAGKPKAPAVATGSPLSSPGPAAPASAGGVTPAFAERVRADAPASSAPTGSVAALADTASGAKPVAAAASRPSAAGPTAALAGSASAASSAGVATLSTASTAAPFPGGAAVAGGTTPAAPTKASVTMDSPAAFQARRAALAARGVRIEEVPADDGLLDLFAVLQRLAELDVNEVLVEAGPALAGQLLTTFFVDELLLYIAPKLLGPQGRPLVNLPELQSLQDAWGFGLFDAKRFGDDLRLRLRPK